MRSIFYIFLSILLLVDMTSTATAETAAEREYRMMKAFCGAEILDLSQVELVKHSVKRGSNLGLIAAQVAPDGTTGTCLVRLNEQVLLPLATERCPLLGQRPDGSYYCNDALGNLNFPTWSNSVQPGDEVFYPVLSETSEPVASSIRAPLVRDVNRAVQTIEGDRIALVVDTSGSMSTSDRAKVADLYNDLLGQRVTHLVSYAEYADVTEVTAANTDVLSLLSNYGGGTEYVGAALQAAAAQGVDAIVLIGDAADNATSKSYAGLPPVTAHCLPDINEVDCTDNFADIASATGGQLVSNVN